MKQIYLDYAATTPVRKEVLQAMLPHFSKKFGNASSLHKIGSEARNAIEQARETLGKTLSARSDEIIFTSGATEANNLALKGAFFARKQKEKNHIIISAIEHHCVLETANWLSRQGGVVSIAPADKYGFVSTEKISNLIRPETFLVSIMHANNEIGTIEPIEEIAKICKEKNVLFHTDAVQSFTKIPIDLKKISADLLSISSHKIYGPKGVGALFVRAGTKLEPLLHGGGHEFGLRSGTENVAGAVGLSVAASLAIKEMKKEMPRQQKLRDKLILEILKFENVWLNGPREKRLPNNSNFTFRGHDGDSLVLQLSEKGICASVGSACSTKESKPSHVLKAIGLNDKDARASLRFSLGRETKREDIDKVVNALEKILK